MRYNVKINYHIYFCLKKERGNLNFDIINQKKYY